MTDMTPEQATEAWRWNDVGEMSREEVRRAGQEARFTTEVSGSCLVIYEPGDVTRYEVLFTQPTEIQPASAAPTHCPEPGAYYASIVNMGSAYILGGGWKHPDYVAEHWLCGGRKMAGGSVLAIANLFNAFEGQL